MHRLLVILTLFLAAPQLALAAGTGGSGWGSDTASDNGAFAAGKKAVEAGDYRRAISELEKVVSADGRNADAFNLLGFSHRKLGDRERALNNYERALAIDPDHKGANEYLGELYLQMGDLPKAEERLARLNRICLFGCAEYTQLKDAIAAHKAGKGSASAN